MAARKTALAAHFYTKARTRPREDPLRVVAEAEVPSRLSSVRGWRTVGQEACREAGVEAPVEPVVPPRIPPWMDCSAVTFDLEAGERPPPGDRAERRREGAAFHLASLPQCATWAWTDGSAEGGVKNGGTGVHYGVHYSYEIRAPAGAACSSYRAELIALRAALGHIVENPAHEEDPIVCCTDSQAALVTLGGGPAEQPTRLCTDVWEALLQLAERGRRVILQWVPSHCGLPGNERADVLAKEASALPQDEVERDTQTVFRAAARVARARVARQRPPGWYMQGADGGQMAATRVRRRPKHSDRRTPAEGGPLHHGRFGRASLVELQKNNFDICY